MYYFTVFFFWPKCTFPNLGYTDVSIQTTQLLKIHTKRQLTSKEFSIK